MKTIDQELKEEKTKSKYLQHIIDIKNGGEGRIIDNIDNLKRIINLQIAIRKIIQQYNEYSESVDEQPNQWFVEACEIAEKALQESATIDPDFEIRKEVKDIESELLKVKAEKEELWNSLASLKYAYSDEILKSTSDAVDALLLKIKPVEDSKPELESKEPLELQYYQAPDNSLISIHDYQHLSTSQQKQCKPIFS